MLLTSCRHGLICPNLKHYPVIRLEKLRKITKERSQDSRSPDRDLDLGPPKYEAVVLTTTFGASEKKVSGQSQ
jgi:hypothetical protein